MEGGIELEYVFEPRRALSKRVDGAPDLAAPLDAEPWRSLPPAGNLFNKYLRGEEAHLPTDVRICHTASALYVAFRCRDTAKVARNEVGFNQLSSKAEGRFDWVEVLVDSAHDHMRALRVKLDANGHAEAWQVLGMRDETLNSAHNDGTELASGANLHSTVRVTDSGWEGAVEIPFAKLGVEGEPDGRVFGFDFERIKTTIPRKHWRWAPGFAGFDNTPLEFGDLYVGERDRLVTKLDFGRVLWEGSRLAIEVGPADAQAGGRRRSGSTGLELVSRVVMPYDNEVYDSKTASAKAPRGGPASIETSFALSHRGRWPVESEYIQRLELELREKPSGGAIWSGSFPFHFCACMKPNEPYGASPAEGDPARSDPDFLRKKRRHVANLLPRFERRNTASGAPSDFTLTSADGKHEFDLMKPGALKGLAEMVESLFATEEDRLIGAMLLIHQRTVTRHAANYTRLFPLSPVSILRVGGGICGVRSPALCGLISLMTSPRTGRPYHTRVIEIGGHTVTGVCDDASQSDAELVVLDADVGLFFYLPDNSRLARLADLERDRSIAYRSNVNNFRYDHEMFSDKRFHNTHEWPSHGSYPEGAPEW